jgi:solute carrier family 34 (sodium-dependent phosphate cotransporter)
MSENRDLIQPHFKAITIFQMLLALVLFMFSIDLLTLSMIRMNNSLAEELFQATNNPFVGLFIGLLMTALIQSSSTVTSMIVAVVASGQLTLGQAVPLVMGANIGTTLTSTLIAFGFIMKKKEFKKAMAAGVLHDIYNMLTVLILFPLEVYFGFLSRLSSYFTTTFFDLTGNDQSHYTYNVMFTRPFSLWVIELLKSPLLSLIFSILCLFLAIRFLSQSVFKSFVSPNFTDVSKHIFKAPLRSFAYGVFITAAAQSSTVTTSLIVPAVVSRKIGLNKVFPFIIGSNIGTTITAAIAAIYKTEAAISIALVHFLFNIIGALIFMPFSYIRHIPVRLASYLGKESVKHRIFAFAYILLMFFVLPFLLIYFNRDGEVIEAKENLNVSTALSHQPFNEDFAIEQIPQLKLRNWSQSYQHLPELALLPVHRF